MRAFCIEGRWEEGEPRYYLWELDPEDSPLYNKSSWEAIGVDDDIKLGEIYDMLREMGEIVGVRREGDLYRYVKVDDNERRNSQAH